MSWLRRRPDERLEAVLEAATVGVWGNTQGFV